MPAEFQISDEDIAYSEAVLLPTGAVFDEERRDFIKCLETVDLQAVPGSGKTTTLLAKLLVLERHLSPGSFKGVLVISHTNAAVDEIRNRIGEVCPNIFSYPNYVGTIQSFVDRFLAIPSFVNELGFRPDRIDADTYNAEISRRYQSLHQGIKSWVERKSGQDPEGLIQNLRFDSQRNLTNGLGGRVLLKSASASPTYKTLAGLKISLLKSGILHFEDVFLFAERLLNEDSQLKNLLRHRFSFVFVDEMQDMAPHQHGILEAAFGPGTGADTVFQRIGDTDQAIFGENNVVDTEEWQPRTETLTLSHSLRLSEATAGILGPFAYGRGAEFEIRGLGDATIKPHILVYDDESIGNVVGRFANLITQLKTENAIPATTADRFMAVSWNSVWNEAPNPKEGKLRLIDFCPSFRRSTLRKQEEFKCLADHLHSVDSADGTLGSARSVILRSICAALRLCEVVDPRSERPFTPRSLVSYFRFELTEEVYHRINRALLKWSLKLVAEETNSTLRVLRKFLPKLIRHFGSSMDNASDFLAGDPTLENLCEHDDYTRSNSVIIDGIEVGLGTVHSVKGQTHTATLYIESAYYNDGGKMYESQRLAAQFGGERLAQNAGKRVKESARMVYVGFSRPTHLLAFAVHKDRFDQFPNGIDADSWSVVRAYDEGGAD